MTGVAPRLEDVRALRSRLAAWLSETPVIRCPNLERLLAGSVEIYAKLEFLQETGSFKPRGALSVLLGMDDDQLARGVTAVSAGNHAIATAFAAARLSTSAKVVMPRHASALRIRACRELGAELVLADDVHSAFREAESIRDREGRYLVHPFEGPATAAGTGTIGLELCEQLAQFDDVIVPVGGGGLCAGIATVAKLLRPDCRVYGVEPTGADSMYRSFRDGAPARLDRVTTIADSLGAPYALPYSYSLCKASVEEIVLVTDEQLQSAMRVLLRELRVAVEPACAASTAALLGPLAGRLKGRRIVLILCGSNIDWPTYARHAGLAVSHAA